MASQYHSTLAFEIRREAQGPLGHVRRSWHPAESLPASTPFRSDASAPARRHRRAPSSLRIDGLLQEDLCPSPRARFWFARRRGEAKLIPRTTQPKKTINRPHHKFMFIPRALYSWLLGPRRPYRTSAVPMISTRAAT